MLQGRAWRTVALGLWTGTLAAMPARAAEGGVMYRCPGNDYNNTLSAKEARDRGCRTIDGAPVTIVQSPKLRPAPPNSVPQASGPPTARIDPTSQRTRDSDARRILEGELSSEEERLAALRKEFNNGEPERQGNERNYQKYLDRVTEMKAAIARKEGDLAAIKRELGKLPK